jgi:hypothetical protein
LATPLTVCLVVVGRHVERLKFLDIMLGDRPPLTPPQLVYQRMLAGDPMEAAEQAHDHLKNASLDDYYDAVLLKGLRLAEVDNRLGHLNEERLDRIVATVGELVADLETHHDVEATNVTTSDDGSNLGALVAIEQSNDKPIPVPEKWRSPRSVLCIPGATKLDEAAALVLAQIMRHRGFGAIAEKADALSMSKFFSLDLAGTSLVCVCYVDRPSSAKIQYAVRRLTKKSSSAGILLAFLGTESATPVEGSPSVHVAEGSFEVALAALIRATSGQGGGTTVDANSVGKVICPTG